MYLALGCRPCLSRHTVMYYMLVFCFCVTNRTPQGLRSSFSEWLWLRVSHEVTGKTQAGAASPKGLPGLEGAVPRKLTD